MFTFKTVVSRHKRPDITVSSSSDVAGRVTIAKQGKNDPSLVEITLNSPAEVDALIDALTDARRMVDLIS
jgi:hypothetical protein